MSGTEYGASGGDAPTRTLSNQGGNDTFLGEKMSSVELNKLLEMDLNVEDLPKYLT